MLAVLINHPRGWSPRPRLRSVLLTLLRSTIGALRASPLLVAVLVPGTTETYEQGGYRWDGNPWCYEAGFIVEPGSQASTQQIGACYNVVKLDALAPASPTGLGIK